MALVLVGVLDEQADLGGVVRLAEPAADADDLTGVEVVDHPGATEGRRAHHVGEVRRREVAAAVRGTGRSETPGCTARTW